MKWIVKDQQDRSAKIKLPERIPHGVPFPAQVGDEEIVLLWNRQRKVLTWLKDGVEENFELIQARSDRAPNDSQRDIGLQFVGPGQHFATGQVAVDVDSPGREHRQAAKAAAGHEIRSPITGKVLAVNVGNGDQVKSGDILCVIEAMKMENKIFAPADGEIKDLAVQAGEAVASGAPLMNIGPQA